MINLDPSYRGALTAILIVVSLAWMTTPAEAHEAVVVDVDNANGVLASLCVALVKALVEDETLHKEKTQACYQLAADNMYAQPYKHDHS